MMAKALWILFVTSIWIVIGLCSYKMIIYVLSAKQIIDSYPGGYGIKVFVGPFFLFGGELFLWLKMFRYSVHPSRIFAGLVGLYILLMIVFVNAVVADLYDRDVNIFLLILYSYAGLGHIAYALFGKERHY